MPDMDDLLSIDQSGKIQMSDTEKSDWIEYSPEGGG